MKASAQNFLVLQGGGPTPVLNASLCAVIEEARHWAPKARVIGAQSGMHGLCRGELLDLTGLSAARLTQLCNTPGAALGTTRYWPSADELDQALGQLDRHRIGRVIVIGGNGSMRGAAALSRAARDSGRELCVIGVPKTIDNDIAGTDRCPGYGSAARYVAQSVRDLGVDVRSLPQPVSIFETMGRNVGWLAAAAALAKRDEADAPHLIYLPETPFQIDRFIADIDRVVARYGWAVAVISEGLRSPNGTPVYQTRDVAQADDCGRVVPGNVAALLADEVARRLKIRCRSEKPGLCGRASMLHVSEQDRVDADLVARAAVHATLDGENAQMIALRPLERPLEASADEPDQCDRIALSRVAAAPERAIPTEWLNDSDLRVSDAFLAYARPIVGPLNEYLPRLAEIAPPAAPQPVQSASPAQSVQQVRSVALP